MRWWTRQRHGSSGLKKQKRFYSGKKKRHTLKSQIVGDYPSRSIICTVFAHGKMHDWKLLLESGVSFPKGLRILADSGYQGLQNMSGNALIPSKGSKHKPLTKSQKTYNRMLSSYWVVVENVIWLLKRLHILSDRYRNRRKDSHSDSISSQLCIIKNLHLELCNRSNQLLP